MGMVCNNSRYSYRSSNYDISYVMDPEKARQIAERNRQARDEEIKKYPSIYDDLMSVLGPKTLSESSYSNLVDYLKTVEPAIDYDDVRVKNIIQIVFSFGLDEGVKESIRRIQLNPKLNELIRKVNKSR